MAIKDLVGGIVGTKWFIAIFPYALGLLLGGFVVLGISTLYWKDQAEDSRKEITDLNVKSILHEEALATKDVVINGLRGVVLDCVNKRISAEQRAQQAESNLEIRKDMLKTRSEKALDEIKAQKPAICSTPVSPRATELLIEATNRANRVGNGT